KFIKEHGGVTMAQIADGEPPLNPEMPQSAIATGFVDFALPAKDMAAKLAEVRDGRSTLESMVLDVNEKRKADPAEVQKIISDVLLEHSGNDFAGYKSKTFFRRVARRMQVRQTADLDSYCALLRRDQAEVTAMFRDLLISVTNFFRDTEAFEAIEKTVIPALFEHRGHKSQLRLWVPACTTGEEVYSLAILLSEHMEREGLTNQVQIFATDIDEPALAVARLGRYPEQLLTDVSAERLSRFFQRDGTAYVVTKKVREMCIFSPHNVISDPPFSRMDMVSCRNLLIYFGPDLQRQILPVFHYALRPDGYLFLGTSESISQYGDLFRTVDKRHRIFQAIEMPNRHWTPSGLLARTAADTPPSSSDGLSGVQLRHRIERHILDNHTPAHAVVHED
ncbi:hypothetical protein LCGC14_2870880, partial [marine sediment metagenome]